MVSRELMLMNGGGFHLRPAGEFALAMSKYSSEITIKFGGNTVNGKSVTDMLKAGINNGAGITVECSGSDEKAMLEEASAIIAGGLFL